jgi:hypothetical protein
MRTLLEIPQAETPNKTLSLLHNPLVWFWLDSGLIHKKLLRITLILWQTN